VGESNPKETLALQSFEVLGGVVQTVGVIHPQPGDFAFTDEFED
jgi:hypothetical protein